MQPPDVRLLKLMTRPAALESLMRLDRWQLAEMAGDLDLDTPDKASRAALAAAIVVYTHGRPAAPAAAPTFEQQRLF